MFIRLMYINTFFKIIYSCILQCKLCKVINCIAYMAFINLFLYLRLKKEEKETLCVWAFLFLFFFLIEGREIKLMKAIYFIQILNSTLFIEFFKPRRLFMWDTKSFTYKMESILAELTNFSYLTSVGKPFALKILV